MKSRIRHKALSVSAIALVLALALTACGRSPESSGAPTATSFKTGKATGTITVWACGTEGDYLSKYVKDFEKANPGVTIKTTSIPWANAYDKIATAIASGQGPDVAMIAPQWIPQFYKGLESAPKGALDTAAVLPDLLATGQFKGAQYSVPWYGDTRVLYYNSALAKKADVKAPTTWKDFPTFLSALKDAGADSGIFLPTDDSLQLLPFVWQAGGSVMNSAQTKFTFDSAAWVKALTYYKSFFDKGLADVDTNKSTYQAAFVNGQLAAFIGPPSSVGTLKSQGMTSFKLATLPKDRSGTSSGTPVSGVVLKATKNGGAAWKFLNWTSSPDVQVSFYKQLGDLPTTQKALADGALTKDPNFEVFAKQLQDVKSPPAIATWTQVAAVISQEQEKVVRGVESPQEAVKAIQTQAESIGIGN